MKKEELYVNKLKGSNQINKETKVSPSNDQNTITTIRSIDKTSFDHGQKCAIKGLVLKTKTCSKTCKGKKVHLIPTWGMKIKVSPYLHTLSIHLHYM